MENKPYASPSTGRPEALRNSEVEENADKNQKPGQKSSARNDMPPVVAGNKSARPGSQDQAPQNGEDEEADDEALETEEDEDEDDALGNEKKAQPLSRDRTMGDRSTK